MTASAKPLDFDWLERTISGRRLLFFLDFDGTLAEHHPDGERPVISAAAKAALAAIAWRADSRVAIVSGRPIRDLRAKVGLKRLIYAGNHGLEIQGSGETFVHPLKPVIVEAVKRAAELIRSRLKRHPKAVVDVNGLSLSVNIGLVHPENRPAVARIVQGLRAELASMRLEWQEGHLGWDLIPRAGWNKGSVVKRLRKQWPDAVAIAVGDGLSDEAMFRVVGRAGVAIRVGKPAKTRARFELSGPRDVERLLILLA